MRIGLGLLGALALVMATLFLWKPEATLLLLAILVDPLFENTRPPPIAADQVAGANLQNQTETNRKLNALFRQKFPAGTSEGALKAALSAQGFKSLPPPRPDCWPAEKSAPLHQVITPCSTGDMSKVLEYHWGNGVCRDTIAVSWVTDDSQRLTAVTASYYGACL
jgi:hypothetical protein